MGFEWEYVLPYPTYVEPQVSEPGGVGEGRKELGDSDVFLAPLQRVVLGGERQSRRGYAINVNGKRPCELQNMVLLEKRFWSKGTGAPRGVIVASLYGNRIIKQALGKRQPGFANEGASGQHLMLFTIERPLAGHSQDDVNNLQWENRNVPGLGFLRLMK
jgi:hypothetical protein